MKCSECMFGNNYSECSKALQSARNIDKHMGQIIIGCDAGKPVTTPA